MNLDLLLTTLARLSVNLVFRLPYPLLPTISRGLGVPVAFLSMLLAIRSAFAIATPAFSWLPNRLGRRQTVLFLFSITALALGWLAIQPSLLTFCVALAVAMLTKIVFDPLVVTFLSERTPYERRGLVLGLAEFAWAGAALLGLPLCAWWVERQQHWAAAFAPLAVFLLLAGLLGASRFSTRAGSVADASSAAQPKLSPWRILTHRPVLASVLVGLLISFANEVLNVFYANWFENNLGLTLGAIGLSTAFFGVAELLGESGVIGLSDRWGKLQTVLFGAVVSAVLYAVLPVWGLNPVPATIGLFLTFLAFEFTLVAAIPLASEALPAARGMALNFTFAGFSVGRVFGAVIGGAMLGLPIVWAAASGALVNLLAAALLWYWFKNRPST